MGSYLTASRFSTIRAVANKISNGDRGRLSRALSHAGIIVPGTNLNHLRAVHLLAPAIDELALKRALETYNADPRTLSKVIPKESSLILAKKNGQIEIIPAFSFFLSTGVLPPRGMFGEMSDCLQFILANEPANKDALFLKARMYFMLGHVGDSEAMLRDLVEADKSDLKAKRTLSKIIESKGNSFRSLGQHEKAFHLYLEAIKIDNGNRYAAYFLLKTAEETGNTDLIVSALVDLANLSMFKEATQELKELSRKEGEIAGKAKEALFSLYLEQARGAELSNKLEAALGLYKKAILFNDSAEIKQEIAILLYRLGRFEESSSLLMELSGSCFLTPRANAVLAMMYLEAGGSVRAAEKMLERAFGIDRQEKYILLGRAKIKLVTGEFETSARWLELLKGDIPEAAPLLETCWKLLPLREAGNGLTGKEMADLDIDELHLLARALIKRGSRKGAETCCMRILELDGRDTAALYALAKSYKGIRRNPEAERLLRKILTIDPNMSDAFVDLVEILRKKRWYGAAVDLVNAELKRRPTADVLVSAALLFRDKRDTARAKDYLEKALELDQGKHFARIKLIDLLIRGKNESREALREALVHCEEGIGITFEPIAGGEHLMEEDAVDVGSTFTFRYQYMFRKGSVLLMMRRQEEALDVLLDLHEKIATDCEKNREIMGIWLWTRIRTAEAYVDSENIREAEAWLNKARGMGTSDRNAIERIAHLKEKLTARAALP